MSVPFKKEGSMIQLYIIKTSKSYNPKDMWSTYDEEHKFFTSIDEAKQWLSETYPKCKRVKMYADDKNGKSHHIGYIYSYKNYDWSHETGKKEHWIEQHWIEFRSVKTIHFS